MNKDKKEMDDWLDLVSEKVQRNVTVVTPEDMGQDYFLHISRDTNIRDFSPMIGHKQAPSEDRTMPRVCVCPTLLGCLIGFAESESNFLNMTSTGRAQDDKYKGGWKIYALPFKAALRPNGRLVFDANHSDEHWLVGYNKEAVHYKPEAAGKLFFQSITYYPRSGKDAVADCVLYIEVTKEEGIWFSKNHFLKKGYHAIDCSAPRNSSLLWSDRDFKVKKLEKADYVSVKQASADLLGFKETLPSFVSW